MTRRICGIVVDDENASGAHAAASARKRQDECRAGVRRSCRHARSRRAPGQSAARWRGRCRCPAPAAPGRPDRSARTRVAVRARKSPTRNCARRSRRAFAGRSTAISEPAGEYLMALSRSCRSARPSSSPSASTVVPGGTRLANRWPSSRRAHLAQGRGDERGERDGVLDARRTSPASIRSIWTASVTSGLEPVRFFVDDVHELARRRRDGVGELGRRRLDGRQGRLELVGQRVEHGRSQLAALPAPPRRAPSPRGRARAPGRWPRGWRSTAAPYRRAAPRRSASVPIGAPPRLKRHHDRARFVPDRARLGAASRSSVRSISAAPPGRRATRCPRAGRRARRPRSRSLGDLMGDHVRPTRRRRREAGPG